MSAFHVAGRRVGAGAPCFVIAEAGVNHNGELAMAHRLIDAASAAGADAVKFQTFDPDLLASQEAMKAEYQARSTGGHESQLDMLRRLALPRPAHQALKRHAEDSGLVFLSSPFDEGSVDLLVELGIAALKLPSGEITNHRLLDHAARKGLPLILSTGMSQLDEVERAVTRVESAGAPAWALLHCVSSYPAPPEAANLRAMATLRDRFRVPVGFSDHTLGDCIAVAAVALGADILEKHLTLDCGQPGPDHAASLAPVTFQAMVSSLRQVEQSLGDGRKSVQPCELDVRRAARRSLFAARDLAAGSELRQRDLVALRPAGGISPDRLAALLGRRLKKPVSRGKMLHEQDLE